MYLLFDFLLHKRVLERTTVVGDLLSLDIPVAVFRSIEMHYHQ